MVNKVKVTKVQNLGAPERKPMKKQSGPSLQQRSITDFVICRTDCSTDCCLS